MSVSVLVDTRGVVNAFGRAIKLGLAGSRGCAQPGATSEGKVALELVGETQPHGEGPEEAKSGVKRPPLFTAA